MRAISLIQPYATLIMLGYDFKHHETRSWSTAHRGQLAIHASVGRPRWAREAAENELITAALAEHGLAFDTLPRGAVLGTVDVVAMHRITADFVATLTPMEIAAGDYTPDAGRWAWQLENREPFGLPVPCKGALSLWAVPREVEAEFIVA
ncbi:MAG: 2-oxoglutarate dehydrogenase E1 [Hymenobacter sp.]|nr:2-oxoglutarate dehydrogenase E1 [Hymenobacter sp.]